jgi:3-isopropylmalate/(R)-2-methylmalate dehydratase small subunit
VTGWTTHTGVAILLDRESIDTDQLIPARFMSTPRNEGYGDFLLHDMRRDADGDLLDDFPLNAHPRASILVAGRNFGSGSSREAAVYALVDAGFRIVIAPGFGDIFASNAVNNGLLPARVAQSDIDAIRARLAGRAGPAQIDLKAGGGHVAGHRLFFDLDAVWRDKLINGWDDIDLTRAHAPAIDAFASARRTAQAWTVPPAPAFDQNP